MYSVSVALPVAGPAHSCPKYLRPSRRGALRERSAGSEGTGCLGRCGPVKEEENEKKRHSAPQRPGGKPTAEQRRTRQSRAAAKSAEQSCSRASRRLQRDGRAQVLVVGAFLLELAQQVALLPGLLVARENHRVAARRVLAGRLHRLCPPLFAGALWSGALWREPALARACRHVTSAGPLAP